MGLPRFLQSCFPSYDLTKLDIKKDKKLIITQILNNGTEKEIKWLGNNYSQKEIKEVVQNPIKGMWMKSVLEYWQKILGIRHKQKITNQAVINLNPS